MFLHLPSHSLHSVTSRRITELATAQESLAIILVADTVLQSRLADLQLWLQMETKFQVCASKSFTLASSLHELTKSQV